MTFTENGLKLSVEQYGVMACHAYFPANQFLPYSFVSENEANELVIHTHLQTLIECIDVFCTSGAAAVTLQVESSSDQLKLLHEDPGCSYSCELQIIEMQPFSFFDFQISRIAAKIIMSGNVLKTVFRELSGTDTVTFEISREEPCFQILSKSPCGTSKIAFGKNSEAIDSFSCDSDISVSFKSLWILYAVKCLHASSKAALRFNEEGYLSFQCILPHKHDSSFVEYTESGAPKIPSFLLAAKARGPPRAPLAASFFPSKQNAWTRPPLAHDKPLQASIGAANASPEAFEAAEVDPLDKSLRRLPLEKTGRRVFKASSNNGQTHPRFQPSASRPAAEKRGPKLSERRPRGARQSQRTGPDSKRDVAINNAVYSNNMVLEELLAPPILSENKASRLDSEYRQQLLNFVPPVTELQIENSFVGEFKEPINATNFALYEPTVPSLITAERMVRDTIQHEFLQARKNKTVYRPRDMRKFIKSEGAKMSQEIETGDYSRHENVVPSGLKLDKEHCRSAIDTAAHHLRMNPHIHPLIKEAYIRNIAKLVDI